MTDSATHALDPEAFALRLATGELSDADANRLAAAAWAVLTGAAPSLDAALHMTAAGAGRRSAWTRARHTMRDDLLRAAAAALDPDGAPTAQAEALRVVLKTYRAGAWRHEREQASNPHPSTAPRGLLWAALKIDPAAPSSRSKLADIVSEKSGEWGVFAGLDIAASSEQTNRLCGECMR